MTEPSMNADDWKTCPAGAILEYSARDRRGRAAKQLSGISAALAIGCALVGMGYFMLPGKSPMAIPYKGGLSCSEVLENMGSFFEHQLAVVDRHRVLRHLDDCPKCDRIYQNRAVELKTQVALKSPSSRNVSAIATTNLLSLWESRE